MTSDPEENDDLVEMTSLGLWTLRAEDVFYPFFVGGKYWRPDELRRQRVGLYLRWRQEGRPHGLPVKHDDAFLYPGSEYPFLWRSDDLRRANVQTYLRRRRLRPPRAHEAAGRVAFAHDSEQANALRELVADVGRLATESARDGQGRRNGMIAALHIARQLLWRIPGAGLVPIIATLEKLEQALADLDDGIVHSALKPPRRGPGKPYDRRLEEFRRRCIIAALLGELAGDSDPIGQVVEAARDTAPVVGSFAKEEGGPHEVCDKSHPGRPVFSTETVRNWVDEFKTERNKSAKEENVRRWDDDLSPTEERRRLMAEKIERSVGLARRRGTVAVEKLIWLRALSLDNMERSILEIASEFIHTTVRT